MSGRKFLFAVILVLVAFFAFYAQGEVTSVGGDAPSSRANSALIRAFNGKIAGVTAGTMQAAVLPKLLPDSKVFYFDSLDELVKALKNGEIDFCVLGEFSARNVERENNDLTHAKGYLYEFYNAFIFPQTGQREFISDFNAYLRRIKFDGTLDTLIKIWLEGSGARQAVPDWSDLPMRKGTIKIAAASEIRPLAFIDGGKISGFETDIVVRFCKEYGYRPEFKAMPLEDVMAGVSSGDFDIGIGAITITRESAKSVNFSNIIYSDNLICVARRDKMPASLVPDDGVDPIQSGRYSKISDLDGQPIGVQTGSEDWARMAAEILPHSKIVFFDSFLDIVNALYRRKIRCFFADEPVFRVISAANPMLAKFDERIDEDFDLSFAFAKTERGKKLCDEMSEFIRSLKADGRLDRIVEAWEGLDSLEKRIPDYKNFDARNGFVTLAVEGEYPPFNYYRGSEIAGLEVDLAAMFCKAYGYGLKIATSVYDRILPSIESGDYDFGGNFDPLEEQEESVYYSEPYCKSCTVVVTLKSLMSKPAKPISQSKQPGKYTKVSDIDGQPVGMQPGVIDWEEWAKKNLPNSKIHYYQSYADLAAALTTGKIAAFFVDSPVLRLMSAEDSRLSSMDETVGESFGYSFGFAQNEKGARLCDEMSNFVRTLKASGELDAIIAKWEGADESAKTPPNYTGLPAKKGTLNFAAEGSYPPFNYYRGRDLSGIDIDLLVRFCEAYGYGLKVQSMLFDAMIPALTSGKIDIVPDFTPSQEHEEAVYFSEPYCIANSVLAVLKSSRAETAVEKKDHEPVASQESSNAEPTLLGEIFASFEKTFIRENRWELFIEGIINTMIITVLSVMCGIILGFTAFMFCRTGSALANVITKFSVWLIKGTPVVVLLMILYYVIFGSVDIPGMLVSVIAFTLIFATSVYRMLTFGTGAVDRGQTEAAYALGFTDMQTFFKVILPQAALHFMPSLREEVTMLIKSTSIVGYIAVQDLTKMGDIVRSRTYEAFFPLIAVAVIYFVLAGMLNIIVTVIEYRITPSRRKPEDILKGISTGGKFE